MTAADRSKPTGPLIVLVLALVALVALVPTSQAQAAKKLAVPEQSPGAPYYARFGGPPIAPHTERWAAIVFYRDPSCVPAGFNLLTFFAGPAAFRCPLTVEGFEIWENGPGRDPAPRMSKLREAGGVPIWFVSWPELRAAAGDGVLTISELRALPSLVPGVASHFTETLHPTQSNKKGKINIHANGSLADGRAFRFRFVAHDLDVRHVAIKFR